MKFHRDSAKMIEVLRSCQTHAQYDVAMTYLDLFDKKYRNKKYYNDNNFSCIRKAKWACMNKFTTKPSATD